MTSNKQDGRRGRKVLKGRMGQRKRATYLKEVSGHRRRSCNGETGLGDKVLRMQRGGEGEVLRKEAVVEKKRRSKEAEAVGSFGFVAGG